MLLKLSSENLQHLTFLHTADEDVVKEFISISLQFLSNGINRKIFKVAAQKLEVEQDVIENAVLGLMQLFSEATKYKLSSSDLNDSLVVLEFQESTAKLISDSFFSNETQRSLIHCAPTLPTYDNLEWRLDIKLASRSLHQQITPIVRMRLQTSDGDKKNLHMMQIDPVNLSHVLTQVEEALEELKSNHVRRILRNLT